MTKATNLLSHAIYKTIAYSAFYQFPLTIKEIYTRLQYQKASLSKIKKELDNLLSTGQVIYLEGYYTTEGSEKFIHLRKVRQKITTQKLQVARPIINIISKLSWVQAIYLTGSLAVDNGKKQDDLDLMLITSPRRLWLVRFVATFITEILGVRRHPGKNRNIDTNNKFCLNLYLTTNSLAMPHEKRSLYTAYELIQAKKLSDKDDISSKLLSSNTWISTFLPNYPLPKINDNFQLLGEKSSLLDIVNRLAYLMQKIYMSKRLTNEYITIESAFFHPNTHTHNKAKFYTIDSIKTEAQKAKSQKRKIVLATGFFDLLHLEHIRFLQKAKERGDVLIVGVESDQRARLLKGEGRPIETQNLRATKILSTGLVDYVVLLSEDFDNKESYVQLLRNTFVDVYAISSHTGHQRSKRLLVEEEGGKLVIVHKWNNKVSTTQIINSQSQDI